MSVATLLNAATANTTGPVVGLGTAYGNLTASVTTTGTVSALSVVVLGSNDSFNWEAIGAAITSPTAGTSIGSGVLFSYFMATLSGYSGSGTVTCKLAYSLEPSASGGGGSPSGAAGGDLSGTYPDPAVAAINGTPFSLPVSIANGGTGTGTAAAQNEVFAGPTSGTTGAPAFRSLVAADVPVLNQNTTGSSGSCTGNAATATSATTAAGLSSTLAITSGGTGQITAAAAYNALSPMTTTGDIEYESAANTASRLAGNTSTTKKFLTSTGTGSAAQAPAWGTIAAGDLPAIPGQKLIQTTVGTSSATLSTVSTTTMAAYDSGVLCTGSFTAISTSVTVTVDCVAKISASGNYYAMGLAASGTVTPMVCDNYNMEGSTADYQPLHLAFVVNSLTAGDSYNFDLLGCVASTITHTISSYANTSTTPGLDAAAQGSLTVLTVYAN